jgi:hypothetical protein
MDSNDTNGKGRENEEDDDTVPTPSENTSDNQHGPSTMSSGSFSDSFVEEDRKPKAVSKSNDKEAHLIDDKSILQRAYGLIDRTSQRFRHPHQDQLFAHSHAETAAESDRVPPPAISRAQAKAASAYITSSDEKHRHNKALMPGAEHVLSRAPGLSPALYLSLLRRDNARQAHESQQATLSLQETARTTEAATDGSHQAGNESPTPGLVDSIAQVAVIVNDGDTTEPESAPSGKEVIRSRWIWCVGMMLIIVLAVVAVVVGIRVSENQSSPAKKVQTVTTPMDPPTASCDGWINQTQPSAITQCVCIGKITIVADDIQANYQRLTSDGFIQTILPNFASNIDSCDPSNHALVWLASATGSSTPNLRQRFILAMVYIMWNGILWTVNDGWLSSDNECTWNGLSCDRLGDVTQVDLYNNEVTGSLGTAFSLLTSLQAMSLGLNGMRGSLPSELGGLASLTSLVLATNHLTGSLPSELAQLSILQDLTLDDNRITGTIPTWLGQLSNLQTLSLSNNTFSQPGLSHGGADSHSGAGSNRSAFPFEFGLLTNLQTLDLSFNGLHGTIPTEVFNIGNSMQYVNFGENSLTGTIPSLFGNLVGLGRLQTSYYLRTKMLSVLTVRNVV